MQCTNRKITDSIDMNALVLIHVCASDVAVERNNVGQRFVHSFNHIKSISDQVRMLGAPIEKFDFLHGDEAGEIVHFHAGVVAIRLQT